MKNFKKEKNVTGEGWTSVRTFLPKKEKKQNREPKPVSGTLKEWMGGGGTMETQSDVWVQASVFDLKPAKPKKDIIRPLGGTTYYPDGDIHDNLYK